MHQCTKCKRPKQGHPRSGCPYVDSPLKEKERQTPAATTNIADALGSMHIASPTHEDTKAVIHNRRRSSLKSRIVPAETLESLSPSSQEIAERLMQPGMFDDDTDESPRDAKGETTTKVVRWQDTLRPTTPLKPKPIVKMPGSLTTPSPESSQGSKFFLNKQQTLSADKFSLDRSNNDTLPTQTNIPDDLPQPLARSMSFEQREMFISNLTTASDATVYVLPSADIHSIHAFATKLGFHARIAMSMDANDPQGFLVLGRDEKAVQKLFKKVEVESKKAPSSRFRVAAGGAVVGAVGAWAGLAFT